MAISGPSPKEQPVLGVWRRPRERPASNPGEGLSMNPAPQKDDLHDWRGGKENRVAHEVTAVRSGQVFRAFFIIVKSLDLRPRVIKNTRRLCRGMT